jgi:long-subunit acyl-CoA synthetase (AMP-forming)
MSRFESVNSAKAWDSDRVETRQFGGSGKLLAGIEGRIVDGEVQLRGPNMTIGYHNNPKADQEFFAGDGWCRTGDIGRVVSHGVAFECWVLIAR